MSDQFNKIIIKNDHIVLKVNFIGISGENINDIGDLEMSILAYEAITGKPLFISNLDILDVRKFFLYSKNLPIDFKNKKIEDLFKKLNSIDKDLPLKIIKEISSDKKLEEIFHLALNISAQNLSIHYRSRIYKEELDNLKQLLELEENGDIVKDILLFPDLDKYIARQPELVFQNWIENNLWIFGVEYIKKYNFRDIVPNTDEEGGSTADLVMQSADGFLELIELKRAKYDLFKFDRSHHCPKPSANLAGVLGQSLYYLQKLDEYKSLLETENLEIQILRPRVKIIAGRSTNFSILDHKALRMLNSNLSHITVTTYDQLVKNAELLLTHYCD